MFSAGSVCAYEYMHVGAYDGKLVEVRGQFAGLISLLLPWSWGANTGYQVWRQVLYLLSHVAHASIGSLYQLSTPANSPSSTQSVCFRSWAFLGTE